MSEKFYDEVISPQLAELAKLCQAEGMHLVATVQFAPENNATTAALGPDLNVTTLLTAMAATCSGNFDTLIFAAMKHARKHGHSSICLAQLGVPHTPEKPVMQ